MSINDITPAGYIVINDTQDAAPILAAGKTKIMSYKRAVRALGRNIETLRHIPASAALVAAVMDGNAGATVYIISSAGVAVTLEELEQHGR